MMMMVMVMIKITMKIMIIHGLLRRLSMVNSKALVFLHRVFKVLAKTVCSGWENRLDPMPMAFYHGFATYIIGCTHNRWINKYWNYICFKRHQICNLPRKLVYFSWPITTVQFFHFLFSFLGNFLLWFYPGFRDHAVHSLKIETEAN